MNRQFLIDTTIIKIKQLPDTGIKEVNDFADFLLRKIDGKMIQEGIHEMITDSNSFAYLKEEEDLYTVDDLKEKY